MPINLSALAWKNKWGDYKWFEQLHKFISKKVV